MLERVLDYIHNYFYRGTPIRGEFTIANSRLQLDGVQTGQYYHITGSVFNDGIHQRGVESLRDEVFRGVIYPMAVPRAVLEIVDEIEAWNAQYGERVNSPYQSESVIGVYSYQLKGSGSGNGDGGSASWESIFGNRLNQYRKVSGR